MDEKQQATLLRNRWNQMLHEARVAGTDPITLQTALAALVAEWLSGKSEANAAGWLAQVSTWAAESRKRLHAEN